MGIVTSAFKATTGIVGDVFDGVTDRISIAHIANKAGKATSDKSGITKFAVENVKSLVNYATLGVYRNVSLGIKHKDIKAMDDMSKSERGQYVGNIVYEQAKSRYDKACENLGLQDQAVSKKYSDLGLSK